MNNAKVLRTQSMLRFVYAAVPLLVGLDKVFTGLIVDWSKYVSPLVLEYIALPIAHLLILVGVIEIAAGLIVWFFPRFGGYLVAAWMTVIIVNLISMNAFYDIIARDVVIAVGALALAWLTSALQA